MMMVFSHCDPAALNAHAIIPLDRSTKTAVQHAFYDGTLARFGNPNMVV